MPPLQFVDHAHGHGGLPGYHGNQGKTHVAIKQKSVKEVKFHYRYYNCMRKTKELAEGKGIGKWMNFIMKD